jgi:hypothetical protein
VIIVQVRNHSSVWGSFQFSQSPAKVNGRPSFMAKSERQLRFSRFAPFVESVRRNEAAAFGKGLPDYSELGIVPERGRFIITGSGFTPS